MPPVRLESREQLVPMLDLFYARVREDELIGPIFNEVARVDWGPHVAKIYDFWDTLLFGKESYRGRPFPPHVPLGLRGEHFERWLRLFFQTVDETCEGPKADEIKARAYQIGRNFHNHLQMIQGADHPEGEET